MRAVEDSIVTARPDLAGRLDWDTLTYLYNSGAGVDEARHRYLRVYTEGKNGS